MISFESTIQVPFHDVDLLSVAWHGHYAKYCEISRTDLARTIGIDWPELEEKQIVMPIVHFSCEYRKPLLYGKRYAIRATAESPLLPKFCVEYVFTHLETGEFHAKAHTEQVYINRGSGEILFALPDFLKQKIEAATKQNRDSMKSNRGG